MSEKRIREIEKGISEIELEHPIREGDNEITKIKFRNRITWGDSSVFDEGVNQAVVGLKLFTKLTTLPQYHQTTIEKMDMADAERVSEHLSNIIDPAGQKKKLIEK